MGWVIGISLGTIILLLLGILGVLQNIEQRILDFYFENKKMQGETNELLKKIADKKY